MNFDNNKSIYLQIADNICEKILNGEYKKNDKLPSVREMATETGVNPNTIMRTYTELQNDNIIKNKRGIGYFIEDDAYEKIRNQRKSEFFESDFPLFLKQVSLLNFGNSEIDTIIENLKTLKNEDK